MLEMAEYLVTAATVIVLFGVATCFGDDAVEAGLVKFGKNEQILGDMGATGRDSIGRHRLFVTDARRRQRRQGGLAEQHLHIGAQAGLAHALHQLHRQQRMPAE